MNNLDFTAIVNGNNAFAFDLYSVLKNKDGNLFFSPFSISTCLAMAFTGARGNTATEIEKVFHFPFQGERLYSLFKTLLDALLSQRQCEVHVANSLWVKMGYNLIQNYLNVIETYYGKAIFEVNFSTGQAVRQINNWVADNTRGKIRNIMGPLDSLTRFVLVNAIYFKGLWEVQFEKNLTKNEPFTLKSGKKVDVPMMFATDDYYYTEGPNFQMLGMFYKEKRFAMIILLPRSVNDLEEIENNLIREKMDPLFKQLQKQKVKIFVPRFEMTDQFNVEGILKRLGMIDAFDRNRADFSGMTEKENLQIDSIIHKAFVEVNEEGTEAAAATVTSFIGMGLPKKPKPIPVFRADHPFLIFIRDLETKSILFIGRVMNPKS
jgi:serpin B